MKFCDCIIFRRQVILKKCIVDVNLRFRLLILSKVDDYVNGSGLDYWFESVIELTLGH